MNWQGRERDEVVARMRQILSLAGNSVLHAWPKDVNVPTPLDISILLDIMDERLEQINDMERELSPRI